MTDEKPAETPPAPAETPTTPPPAEEPTPAPKPRKKAATKVELGSEVDLGDKPGHLCFPDGGVSSHRGPARFTTPGEYRFVTTDGETVYQVK